jgi:hypothetical protein
MYEMLVGMPPYYANDREELFNNIQKAALKIPSYISSEGKNLLKAVNPPANKCLALIKEPGKKVRVE